MNNDLLNLNRGNCPFRHENGNCLPIGGFCTAVNETICDALQSVYLSGYYKGKQEAEPVQKWIPVSERLPEEMEWVMCACVDGEVNILRYDHIMDDWDLFHRPNRCYKKEYVTHWMPLPSLPKGE